MCGIIGIAGRKEVASRLLDGLKRLEYRGYDSAGIATVNNGKIDRRRASGKLAKLGEVLDKDYLAGNIGIGHTRWATHGQPDERNAHPHMSDKVALVHNGIIENYAELKKEMEDCGFRFESDTDTEVIVCLVTHYINEGMDNYTAADKAIDRLEGTYSIVMIFSGDDDMIVGARQGTPLAVGYGDGEMYVASDSYALASFTDRISFLEDGDRIHMSCDGVRIYNKRSDNIERPIRVTAQSGETAGKGDYPHFMLKEIYEQPEVIGDTLNSFINPATGDVSLPDGALDMLAGASRLTMVACGTAYYACMVAKYWFERIAGVSCDVDVASEFRYREPPMDKGGVAIFVSQSGETLDTLEALRYCRRQGQKIISIVNTIESTMERESDIALHTLAGPEIGVASTKAFTTHLSVIACMVLALAAENGSIGKDEMAEYVAALRGVPNLVSRALKANGKIEKIARDFAGIQNVLFLGRGGMYPIAMEGALKLKEISYIHAEGYAAGEMKHGPIALIDEKTPIAVVAPGNSPLFEKTASNVQETVSRGGRVLLISDSEGVSKMKFQTKWNIELVKAHDFVAPILYAVPVQLLAYHVAYIRGTDVDQPRNLAKSVTVE